MLAASRWWLNPFRTEIPEISVLIYSNRTDFKL